MNSDKKQELLLKIESARKILGIAMEDMAQALGIRYQTYWHWLNRKGNPSRESCKMMEEFLKKNEAKIEECAKDKKAELRRTVKNWKIGR